MEIKDNWEWYDWLTLVVLIFMVIGWIAWGTGKCANWCWQSTWWLGFATLIGHFIASITS